MKPGRGSKVVLTVYHLLTWLALPFALLYHIYRSYSRGRRPALAERFGRLPAAAGRLLDGRPVIWLHAVSVGEVIAARPLIRGLRQNYPGYLLLLSVTTETGKMVAEQDRQADLVIHFPFDILPAVRYLLSRVDPSLIIVMETEIWPVFVQEANRRSIPIMLANGRISDRSYPRYRRLAWFFRHVLTRFSLLGMQTGADQERIIAIGAPAERVHLMGNLKYDIPAIQLAYAQKASLRRAYLLKEDSLLFSAASTHAGEEAQILAVWQELSQQHANLQFVMVPRHPERGGEVELLIQQAGFRCRRRSAMTADDQPLQPDELLLVDTVGELMKIYQLSDMVFVGGSLVPTGGHNLLEPAAAGVPSLFGPYMENFREIAGLALQYGAGVQVAGKQELLDAAADFVASAELRQVIGVNGLKMMRDSGGAVQRYLDAVSKVLVP